jgi:hypothetical protein
MSAAGEAQEIRTCLVVSPCLSAEPCPVIMRYVLCVAVGQREAGHREALASRK